MRWLSLVLILAALGMGACNGADSSGSSAGGSGEKKLRIAVIPKGTLHEFWKSVEAGARQAAEEFGDVEITWKGPLSEGRTEDQITTVESFIADGYDGICLAPLDAVAMRKPVDQALAAGVPVLIFDSALADNAGTVSYVATNNYRGGEMAGEHLAKLLDGRGAVILMRYDLNSESTEQREQGFLDALARHPDITLLSSDQYAGPEEDGAIELGENFLADHGDRLDGVFCPNESSASGMLTALRRDPRGLAGKIKFVGFDAGSNLIDGLEKSHLHGAVLQDPVKIGYESVRLMRDHLLGVEVPARVETGEALVTPENMNDPAIHDLLWPPKVD